MKPRDGPADELRGDIDRVAPLVASDPARALAMVDALIATADAAADDTARARARRVRARALAYAGRFAESIAACGEATAIAAAARDRVEAGRALLASMHGLCELGRLDEAITAGESARTEFSAAGEPVLAARADLNIATAHHRRDDPTRALQALDRARPLLADDATMIGVLENTRGEALLVLNDFSGAEAAFHAARVALDAAGQTLNTGIAEGNLADLAGRHGRLHAALRHFERARRCFETDELDVHAARLLAEQAEMKALLGMPDDALLEYRTALPRLERHGLVIESARAHRGLAGLLIRRGRPDEAQAELAAAASAYRELGQASAVARVDLTRAELALSRGQTAEATQITRAALPALGDRLVDGVLAQHLLARIALAEGDVDAAETAIAGALETARTLDVPPLVGDLLHTSALIRRGQGRLEDAVKFLRQAVEEVERVRGMLQADRFRAAWLGHRTALHEDLVLALLDVDTPATWAEAFSVAELAKSRSLLDQVNAAVTPDADADAGADADAEAAEDAGEHRLLRELHETRAELNALYSRLDDEGGDDVEAGRRWQTALHERERALDALEARLAATRAASPWCAAPVSLGAVRGGLEPGTLLVEYFVAQGRILAFAIDADGVSVQRDLAPLPIVQEHIARLQFEIDRALLPGPRRDDRLLAGVRRELAELHTLLLAPLRDRVDAARRLAIVPHGPLHLVPFHALFDGRRYVVQTHEVHCAPSAAVLQSLPAEASAAGESLVVSASDEQLPLIGREAEEVAQLLSPSRLLDEAVASAVLDAAPRARRIHLACHGRYSSQCPLGSGLRLRDRWLTVRDVYRMQLDADLVTLSACETGVNLVEAGDELVGLVRGFLAAGARSVLVSLWRVGDESTRELMLDFYRLWGPGKRSKASVLREAILGAMERRPHPAFWGPFCLVGRA